ncbi:MAG: DUF2490 domain-containing protein [Bacteroidota bacterium]|nr:DUF2490 domain-containing protein [Bacteroidota bacterium]
MNKYILSGLFLFSSLISFAQVNDAALWVGIGLEKKLTNKFSLELTEELRFNENISELGTIFTEMGASYKIAKRFTIGGNYRFTQRRRVDDFYSIRHRYSLEASYKIKVKKLNFIIRERFQSQYKDGGRDEDGGVAGNYLRSKLSIKLNTGKKVTPFISGELWYQLTNEKGNEFDNVRYQAGIDYELNKFSTFTLGYLINKEFNVNDPWTTYAINLGFKYSF